MFKFGISSVGKMSHLFALLSSLSFYSFVNCVHFIVVHMFWIWQFVHVLFRQTSGSILRSLDWSHITFVYLCQNVIIHFLEIWLNLRILSASFSDFTQNTETYTVWVIVTVWYLKHSGRRTGINVVCAWRGERVYMILN